MTSYESLTDAGLVGKLATKGVKKFIAFEIPTELAKTTYGHHFNVIMGDLHQKDDLRVLDYDGHHIMGLFQLKQLGSPVFHEG